MFTRLEMARRLLDPEKAKRLAGRLTGSHGDLLGMTKEQLEEVVRQTTEELDRLDRPDA